MVTPRSRDCPGCGGRLPMAEAYSDGRYNASAECWQLYGELVAYTVTRRDSEFIHQLAVDTYGAQHVADNPRRIGVAFALIGLYLTCEQGHSGREVQHLHMLLARRSKTWPSFAPPRPAGDVTIQDVVRAEPGLQRDSMLRQWSHSVWEAWRHEHARVKSLFEQVMAD